MQIPNWLRFVALTLVAVPLGYGIASVVDSRLGGISDSGESHQISGGDLVVREVAPSGLGPSSDAREFSKHLDRIHRWGVSTSSFVLRGELESGGSLVRRQTIVVHRSAEGIRETVSLNEAVSGRLTWIARSRQGEDSIAYFPLTNRKVVVLDRDSLAEFAVEMRGMDPQSLESRLFRNPVVERITGGVRLSATVVAKELGQSFIPGDVPEYGLRIDIADGGELRGFDTFGMKHEWKSHLVCTVIDEAQARDELTGILQQMRSDAVLERDIGFGQALEAERRAGERAVAL